MRYEWGSSKTGTRTFVVWKVVLHWADWQLLLEAVDLIQEQDDTRLGEPSRIANAVKKGKSLLHTVDGFIFEKELIVFGYGNQEKNGGDVLEAVYPFLPF